MAVDLVCVALLADVEGPWLIVALGLVALLLARRKLSAGRAWAGWVFVALLALLLAGQAWEHFTSPRTVKATVAAALTAAADDDAEDEADQAPGAATLPPAADSDAASAALPASAAAAAQRDARRIAALEAEVRRLRQPKAWPWSKQLRRALDEIGLSLGWGIVYFSLLPAWWNGQTVGKRWFKLRTVELTGRPLTVMRSLRRYGGYAAGMATGGLGFLQALWDVNRQAIQDRVAHTVVVDLREPVQVAAVRLATVAHPTGPGSEPDRIGPDQKP
jgi:uncharacterized RDD family membrane protein YckC